jgi:hypothetical protein
MYEHVETGPLYDDVVRWMGRFRSLQARLFGAKRNTQKKLDRTLDSLGERIDERLNELNDQQRSALDCWKIGILPGTYEFDKKRIMEKPYCSIRVIHRWDEVQDVTAAGQELDSERQTQEEQEMEEFFEELRDRKRRREQ